MISLYFIKYTFFLCPTIFTNNNSNKFNPKKLQVLSSADFISNNCFCTYVYVMSWREFAKVNRVINTSESSCELKVYLEYLYITCNLKFCHSGNWMLHVPEVWKGDLMENLCHLVPFQSPISWLNDRTLLKKIFQTKLMLIFCDFFVCFCGRIASYTTLFTIQWQLHVNL